MFLVIRMLVPHLLLLCLKYSFDQSTDLSSLNHASYLHIFFSGWMGSGISLNANIKDDLEKTSLYSDQLNISNLVTTGVVASYALLRTLLRMSLFCLVVN